MSNKFSQISQLKLLGLIILSLLFVRACVIFRKKSAPEAKFVERDTLAVVEKTEKLPLDSAFVLQADISEQHSVLRGEDIAETVKNDSVSAIASLLSSAISTKDTFTVIGVGDIMLGTNFPSKDYLPSNNDCTPLMQDVLPILQSADVTFGNLEGAFSDDAPVTKRCQDPTKCYAFRTPEKYFNCIVEAGFDLLSLANNHVGDLGEKGRKNTVRLIEEAKLEHAGLLTHPTAIFENEGLKFGFCAFSPNNGTCRINDLDKAKKIVSRLQDSCDLVIVSFHGGAEGRKHQHVPRKTEMFYGENRGNVYKFAHELIDVGADIVFGHGPHVTRAIEVYKKRFIIYSLGNFCTYSRMNLQGVNAIAPIMKVSVSRNGEFLEGEIIPVRQIKGVGTKIDPEKTVIHKLIELTKTDFPEVGLLITEEGKVYSK